MHEHIHEHMYTHTVPFLEHPALSLLTSYGGAIKIILNIWIGDVVTGPTRQGDQ